MVNMKMITSAAVGLLVVTIVMTLGPTLGYKVENSVGTPAGGSNWDNTNVTTTGADVYDDNAGILSVAILLGFISLGLTYLYQMRQE